MKGVEICSQCGELCTEQVFTDAHRFLDGTGSSTQLYFCSRECKRDYHWDEEIQNELDDAIARAAVLLEEESDRLEERRQTVETEYQEKLRRELMELHKKVCPACVRAFSRIRS